MSVKTSRRALVLSIILLLSGAGIGAAIGYATWGTQVFRSAPKPETITIAIQPTEASSEIASRAQQLEAFLESRVGVDIKIYVPTAYASVVEAVRFGNAQVAFMSAWPAAIANKLAGAEIVLAEVREVVIGEDKRNEPFYFSYWVVHKDSPFNSLSELRGKKVCFPSQISTSGYVFPVARLVELGLITTPEGGEANPSDFFGEVVFGGGYGQCWTALSVGQADVAVIAGDVSETLYRTVIDGTRVLEQQGPIPSHAVVFSKDFKDPLRTKLIDALQELGSPDLRDMMRKFISGIFVNFKTTTTSEHLAGLQEALDLSGFKFTERLG